MKKIQLKKGLSFNKETVSKLNFDQLSGIKGGGIPQARCSQGPVCSCCYQSCHTVDTIGMI